MAINDIKIKFSKLLREDARGNNTVVANFQVEGANDVEVFVREFLQNVLDNRIRNNGVHEEATVEIKFLEIEDDSKRSYVNDIFAPALPKICLTDPSCANTIPDVTEALILEEYQTQGIRGVKDDSNHHGKWAKFWHHQDDGNKVGSKNGRAGQGKITYFMMSKVWSAFGLTNTIDDPEKFFLMGKCILPKYVPAEDNNPAYKYHAFISDYKPFPDGDNQPIPYEDAETIEKFRDVFSISRKLGQSGTSWVIPFPKHRPKESELIAAVIKFYFYSILRERLTVKIGETSINKDTISKLARKYLPSVDADFYEFIKEAVDISTEYRRVTVHNESWAKKTTFPADLINDEKTEELKNDLSKGEIVYIRLPITLKPVDGRKIDSYFDVYLKSDKSIKETREAFIRSDLFIAKEKKFDNMPGKLYCLVVAEHEDVASFLADAEEPNHLLFNAEKQLVTDHYKDVSKTLRAIRMGAVRVYNHLTQRESETVEDLFLGLISFPSSRTKKKKKKKKTGVVLPPPPPRASWFRIKEGIGAEIRPGERKFKPEQLPVRIIIQAGYQSLGSNPFNDHHPFDFNFMDEDSVSIELKNMKRIDDKVRPNSIEFDIEDEDFYAKFSGFDSNRRLKVKGKLDDTNLPDDEELFLEELLDDEEL